MILRFQHRWASGCVCSLLVAAIFAASPAPSSAQPAPVPADALSPEQANRLHTSMLDLRRMQREGNRAGAIQLGEQLLREFPDNRRAEDALLDLYRIERRDDELMALLQRRIARDPSALDETRELCTYLLAHRRSSDALAILEQVIAANPLDESRYRLGAVLMRSHGQTGLAADIYRKGRKAIGREGIFATELAQLAEASGDYETAIGEYLLLVMDPEQRSRARRKIVRLIERAEDPKVVLSQIDKLRHRHPKSAALEDVAATVLLQVGDLDRAFSAVRAADRYAEDQGEHLLEFGRAALQNEEGKPVDLERTRLGVRVLNLLPEAHPESNLLPEASRLLAEGLVTVARQATDPASRRELLDEALRSLDASVNDSRFVAVQRDALALKALILYEDLGQPEAALQTFEALVQRQQELGESDHMARVQMALCLAATERYAEARTLLEQVASSDAAAPTPPQPSQMRNQPTPENIGRARARYHLAELDLVEGEYDRARDGFAALAEAAPEDRLANDCLDLALTLSEASLEDSTALGRYAQYHQALLRRKPEEARAVLEQFVANQTASSLHALASFELGKGLVAAGKYEEALQQFAALVVTHPEHRLAPRALEATGDLQLDKLRRREEAMATYERILLEYPDDLFQDDVRKKLLAARTPTPEEDDRATP